jgi:hypothetical protein
MPAASVPHHLINHSARDGSVLQRGREGGRRSWGRADAGMTRRLPTTHSRPRAALSGVKEILTAAHVAVTCESRDEAGGSRRAADGGREEPNRHERSVLDRDRRSARQGPLTWRLSRACTVLNGVEFHAGGPVQISHGGSRLGSRSALGPCRNGRPRASAVTNSHRRSAGTAGRRKQHSVIRIPGCPSRPGNATLRCAWPASLCGSSCLGRSWVTSNPGGPPGPGAAVPARPTPSSHPGPGGRWRSRRSARGRRERRRRPEVQ